MPTSSESPGAPGTAAPQHEAKGALALRVEGLSKRYKLGGRQTAAYRTLREHLVGAVGAPFRRLRAVARGESATGGEEILWALRDVSFEVRHGEVLGVVGHNGAGKTTLLKILSRITTPTSGRALLFDRVGSLLEVGTGFHPELTGRENIFLNGAILGMPKREVEKKFDEIVAFSEVERFLDTQVKFYSSGMYVRLAFAVAAHLDPEILLVDEVLSVGDAAFQKKCLGKMGEVAGAGRTVVFVSHNMEAVQRLCTRCLWLDRGRLTADGEPHRVVSTYLRKAGGELAAQWRRDPSAPEGDDPLVLLSAHLEDVAGRPRDHVRFGEPFALRLRWEHRQPVPGAEYFLRVFDPQGRFLFGVSTPVAAPGAQSYEAVCRIEENVLLPGVYRIGVGCYRRPGTILHEVPDCIELSVFDVPHGERQPNFSRNSIFLPAHRWEPDDGAPDLH